MNDRLVDIRAQQIFDARKKIDEEKKASIIKKEAFLKSFKKSKILAQDNPSAAYLGYMDSKGNVYYCPIESFTKEDIAAIEYYRFGDKIRDKK